jgi:UDP-2,3-diacylglucosamine pyrophosphatase LpxH
LKTSSILDDKYKIADMAAAILLILVLVFNLSSRRIGNSLENKMRSTKEPKMKALRKAADGKKQGEKQNTAV